MRLSWSRPDAAMSARATDNGLAVVLEGVSKRYSIGDRRGLLSRAVQPQALWALREVSLQVAPGESVGLIGHNGAGKTTLLRLLAGITRPTLGRVRALGRVASLINLGAGFHAELTGRENVYLNGVILGLTRREVSSRFEAIVDFADLGEYIDTPVKRYSSGMVARLGFAVAAFVEPDVLLVDEVLSVGDVAFQDRSIRKMLSFRDSGQAILFVSHNLSAVEMMCQRTIWLDHGTVRMQGPTPDVVGAYLAAVDKALIEASEQPPIPDGDRAPATGSGSVGPVVIRDVSLSNTSGEPTADFGFGDQLRAHVRCLATRSVYDVCCTLTVRGDYGPLFSATSSVFEAWEPGIHELDCLFEELPLLPGLYRLEVELACSGAASASLPRTMSAFRIVTDLAEYGSQSVVGATKSRGGFLAVAYEWRLQSTDGVALLPGLHLPRNITASRPP
jgi:ABC-type polysaccharide/polyol phosphate transport system ATPase subunit